MKEQIEKQAIEEMAKVIKSSLDGLGIGNFNFTGDEISTMFAKALYNAGYRKQEWISVEERLPKDSERVLVYGEKGICFATRYKRDWMTPMRYNGEITHWMPLPEPPKMKGD